MTTATRLLWETNNLKNFTSMRLAFDNLNDDQIIEMVNSGQTQNSFSTIIENNSELEIVRNIDFDALATLTNKDGFLVIGTHLYKIYYDRVEEYSINSLANLNTVELSNLSKENTYITERILTPQKYLSGKIEGDAALCIDYYFTKDKRRFASEIWVTNTAPLYSGAGARAKHQKKVLGIWGNSKTLQLRLNFDITYTGLYFGLDEITERVTYDSGVKYNEKKIEYTWDFCVNVNCSFSATGWSRVSGIGDDGSSQGCTASNL